MTFLDTGMPIIDFRIDWQSRSLSLKPDGRAIKDSGGRYGGPGSRPSSASAAAAHSFSISSERQLHR